MAKVTKKAIKKNIKKQTLQHFKGSVRKRLVNRNGKIIYDATNHNLVVTAGTNFLATWLTASTQSTPFMSYVGLGTGSAIPTSGDTTLQSELSGGGYSRQQGTLTSPSAGVWQNETIFGPGNGTGALTEAGLFSVSSGGTMFARDTFSVINKGSGNTLIVTWQVTISA